MSTNIKLESYLTTLNEHLGAISVSDRSEIIMEIKSHVLDAIDKHPEKSIEDVLKDFGSAESIAQKYLDQRGIKVPQKTKSPFSTFVKWALIASASLMILLSICLLLLIKSLTPFVEVNGDKVSLMGGLIHVDDKNFRLGHTLYEIDGAYKTSNLKEVKITASNGRLELSQSPTDEVTWDCNVDSQEPVKPLAGGDRVELDLTKYKEMDCEVSIPTKIASSIIMGNGKINIDEPSAKLDVSLQNGAIEITPAQGVNYNYDLEVRLGMLDKFTSSDAKNAIPVKARLQNGKIQNSMD